MSRWCGSYDHQVAAEDYADSVAFADDAARIQRHLELQLFDLQGRPVRRWGRYP